MRDTFKPTSSSRSRALVALVACLCLGVVASATAAVYVYSNNFSSKSDLRELKRKSGGGAACDASRPGKGGFMKIKVSKPAYCGYVPPVTSDSRQPDIHLKAKGKIGTSTPGSQRKAAFLAIRVRSGGGENYELMVKPRRRRFELSRSPNTGGVPIKGKAGVLKGIGKNNTLHLQATNKRVIARVNGRKVAKFVDPNPGNVGGRRVMFGVGTTKNSSQPVNARYSKVKVGVPRP